MSNVVIVREQSRVFVTSPVPQVTTVNVPGLPGAAGQGIVLLGTFSTLAALQATHPTGSVGDAYSIVGVLYVWDVDLSAWAYVGPLQGSPGKPGQIRFTGVGEPGTIIGSSPDDTYLDLATGNVYTLT